MWHFFLVVLLINTLTPNIASIISNTTECLGNPGGTDKKSIFIFGLKGLACMFGDALGVWAQVQINADIALDEAEVLKQMGKLESTIGAINSKVDTALKKQAETMDLLQNLPGILKSLVTQNDLDKYLRDLNTLQKQYERYSKNVTGFSKYTLMKFAKTVVSHGFNSVEFILAQIHSIIVPPHSALNNKGVLDDLADTLQKPFKDVCELNQSPQVIFYNFYGNLIYPRLRAATMKYFAYSILKLFGNGSLYEAEAYLFHDLLQSDIKKEFMVVENHLKYLSRVLWRCDPDNHVEGSTFVEVTRLLQGIIINQYDIKSCRGYNCRDFTYFEGWSVKCTDPDNVCKRQRKCYGPIRDCVHYTGSPLTVRVAQGGSTSRLTYVNTPSERYGDWSDAQDSDNVISNIKSYYSWWWVRYCDYCLCLCDDRSDADRYLNLRPVMAEFTKNYVVTGLRFVKHNRIIHLQIQEGELLQTGDIKTSTVRWRPVDNYNSYTGREGVDYSYLKIGHRDVMLDDVSVENEEVIVGVRIIKRGSIHALSVAAARFNFTKEVLIINSDRPRWIDIIHNRKDFNLHGRKISYRKGSKSTEHKNHVVTWFVPTGWHADAAQRTVPSLDAQPVVSVSPMPLQGVGLYWKGEDKHGGFIAPRIISYDILNYLNNE